MTNSQIQARLEKAYQEETEYNAEFNKFLAQSGRALNSEPELCYIPEFRKGEKYLFLDERADFEPTNSYLNYKEECAEAIKKVRDEAGNFILNKESTLAFFDAHLSLYQSLFHQWNYRAYHIFRGLYFYIISWIKYYLKGDSAKVAMATFTSYTKDDILDWLDDHNRLFYCNAVFWQSPCIDTVDEENHLYKAYSDIVSTAYLQGKEITDCIAFGKLYTKYHKQYFEQD